MTPPDPNESARIHVPRSAPSHYLVFEGMAKPGGIENSWYSWLTLPNDDQIVDVLSVLLDLEEEQLETELRDQAGQGASLRTLRSIRKRRLGVSIWSVPIHSEGEPNSLENVDRSVQHLAHSGRRQRADLVFFLIDRSAIADWVEQVRDLAAQSSDAHRTKLRQAVQCGLEASCVSISGSLA